MNTPITLGNHLHQHTWSAQCKLFRLGELAQFSYNAFDAAVASVGNSETDEYEIQYPIGMNPDGQPLLAACRTWAVLFEMKAKKGKAKKGSNVEYRI